MNCLSTVKSAAATRFRPASSDPLVLGASTGPEGRPARRVLRVSPLADGKSEALAAGAGVEDVESPPPQPTRTVATAIAAPSDDKRLITARTPKASMTF